jgi:acyl-CoA thioester hydrolase
VRYSEADAQGVVFNAHHLTRFDKGITEYFRAIKYDQRSHARTSGADFHVVKSVVDYPAPVQFDQEIELGTRVARLGSSSVVFALGILPRKRGGAAKEESFESTPIRRRIAPYR